MPKLPTPKPPPFVDSLITGINSLYVTIISFTLIYLYVGYTVYAHNQGLEILGDVDRLLGIRYFGAIGHAPARGATMKDLLSFYELANNEYWDRLFKEPDKAVVDEQFGAAAVSTATIYRDVPFRIAPGGKCEALVVPLAAGAKLTAQALTQVQEAETLETGRIEIITHSCRPGGKRLQYIRLHLADGEIAFAIPRDTTTLFGSFPHFPELQRYLYVSSSQLETIRSQIPAAISKYIVFDPFYVVRQSSSIDSLILAAATRQLKKFFTWDALDSAVQQLFDVKERDASYMGITATSTFIVRMGPLIYFFLSFELWRRVRRLPSRRIDCEKYWFAFETADPIGRLSAYAHASIPVLVGVLVYSMFAVSQGLILVVFDRAISIPGLMTLTFPKIPVGATYTDHFALVLAYAVVPIHFWFLLLTVHRLIAVVRLNSRKS